MNTERQIRQASNTVHNQVDQAANMAQQQVRQVAPGYAQEANQVIDQVQEQAHQVTKEVRQQANQLVSTMQEQASTVVGEQMDQATNTVGSVASALRQSSRELHAENQGFIAQYVDEAADQLDRVATYLHNSDPSDFNNIIGDVEDFARREPALFLGGAMVAGLFLSRFLKSSTPQERTPSRSRSGSTSRRRQVPPRSTYRNQRIGSRPQRGPTGYEKRVNR